MRYFLLEPEVAGELGENSVIERDSGKMQVTKLHHVFTGWLGDDLLECYPCFLGTVNLINALNRNHLTGYSIDDLEASASYEFGQLYPERELPEFRWIKVDGKAGNDDFGVTANSNLIVSENVLEVLKAFAVNLCGIEEYVIER